MHTALNNLLFGRWWMDSRLGFSFLESKALQLLPLGMPIDLYMMRHGLSLQNIAASYLRAGKFKEFLALYREAAEFLKGCRGPQIPLVQEGRLQAQAAHRWFAEELKFHPIHRLYLSDFLRAAESCDWAFHGLVERHRWRVRSNLCERSWGLLEGFPEEMLAEMEAFNKEMELDPLLATPPLGESMFGAHTRGNLPLFVHLARKASLQSVAYVGHGEMIWGARFHIERMTRKRYRELHLNRDPKVRIANCDIVHYTRRDPETGALNPFYSHVRKICPWDKTRNIDWERISREQTREEFLDLVHEQREKNPFDIPLASRD